MLLTLRGTGEIAGAGGLHIPDWTVPALENAWWGRKAIWARVFVTQGKAVLEWGFETLKAPSAQRIGSGPARMGAEVAAHQP